MLFGPNVPLPTRVRDLPPRARDLQQKLGETIDQFRRYYPDTTESDIRQALMATGGQLNTARRRVLAVVFAGFLAIGTVLIVATRGAAPNIPPQAWLGVAATAGALIVAIVRLARRD